MNNNFKDSYFGYEEDFKRKKIQRKNENNFYNDNDLFEYFNDFTSEEFPDNHSNLSNINSQKINEVLKRKQKFKKNTNEIYFDEQTKSTMDVIYITKTLTKVWSTSKTNTNTLNINPNKQDLYVENSHEIKLNEKIINLLDQKTRILFTELNKKYKMCISKLEEVINYFRATDSGGFKWNEDKLRSINEENIVKIKYEFKNWVNENQDNIDENVLNEVMIEYLNRLDIEYYELESILNELKNFIMVQKINSEKEIKPKKLSKKQKIWIFIFSVVLFLIVSIVVTLLLLSLFSK